MRYSRWGDEIFWGDIVQGPLEQAPETLNRVGMSVAVSIGNTVIDDFVRHELLDTLIDLPLE